MSQVRVGIIRVISLTNPNEVNVHGRLLETAFPGLISISKVIKGFPDGLYTPELEQEAVPEIVRVGRELAANVDVLTVSCAADPGVRELRRTVSSPVIGAGFALGAVCRAMGEKVGIITITPYLPEAIGDALSGRKVEWRSVKGVTKTTDLAGTADGIIDVAKDLISSGCQVIGFGCTGFTTIGTVLALRQALSIPVIDPVLALGSVIAAAFRPG